jgi:hypothetical protein
VVSGVWSAVCWPVWAVCCAGWPRESAGWFGACSEADAWLAFEVEAVAADDGPVVVVPKAP